MVMKKEVPMNMLRGFPSLGQRSKKGNVQVKYQNEIDMIQSYCGSLEGKRALEIGSANPPDFIAEIDAAFELKEAVGINLEAQDRQFTASLRTQVGDARSLSFSDDYFDLIVSSAVFEHVHNFDQAMKEMYRVTKPSGYLFAIVGPIWSCTYGHHLWMHIDGKTVNYHTLALPPFCHLLMSRQEVEAWMKEREIPHAAEIAEFVFNSPCQNRLMFSEYDKAVRNSGFEILYFKGCDEYSLRHLYNTKITSDQLGSLNRMFPDDRDRFLYEGIVMLLRKPL
jgi:SAM-dependent methyltransferase